MRSCPLPPGSGDADIVLLPGDSERRGCHFGDGGLSTRSCSAPPTCTTCPSRWVAKTSQPSALPTQFITTMVPRFRTVTGISAATRLKSGRMPRDNLLAKVTSLPGAHAGSFAPEPEGAIVSQGFLPSPGLCSLF